VCFAGHFSGVTVFLVIAVYAYLLGSIPSGYLAGRLRGIDLRKEGSGNIGATNALRVLGKRLGYWVLAADLLKGWLAVMGAFLIARQQGGASEQFVVNCGVLAAALVVIGHSFPVWLGFQGCKGIATSAGVMLALFPPFVFGFGLAVWVVLFFSTRYVSVASLGAAVALPTSAVFLMILGQCDPVRAVIAGIMCGLAIWRHKDNIGRLVAGTEKRFERKPKVES
jgi:glycerol-3-phosphate acyltransferase PlsY